MSRVTKRPYTSRANQAAAQHLVEWNWKLNGTGSEPVGENELGICYSKTEGELTLSAWTDASWGEDPDHSRSTNGLRNTHAGENQ